MSDLPTLVVFAVQAAYWGTVLAMALARRLGGRASGLVPASRAERWLWAGFVPAVATLVGAPAVAVGEGSPGPSLVPDALAGLPAVAALRGGAALVAAACLVATLPCWRRLGTAWSVAVVPHEAPALVTAGPYAAVRHPIYALGSLLALATAVVLPTLPVVFAAALHVVLLVRKARLEEELLARRDPDGWARYTAATGFFLPRRQDRRPPPR